MTAKACFFLGEDQTLLFLTATLKMMAADDIAFIILPSFLFNILILVQISLLWCNLESQLHHLGIAPFSVFTAFCNVTDRTITDCKHP